MGAVVDRDEKPVAGLSAWNVQCRRSRKREACVLTAVCVLSSIGGTQQSCNINVAPSQILVFIFSAIYAGHACAIALINVTALNHKLLDHTMKWRVGVRHAVVLGRTQLAETTWLLSASSALVPRTPYLLPYFSHVFGAWSVKSSKTSLPAGCPLMSTSRKVRGRLAAAITARCRVFDSRATAEAAASLGTGA